ncbi:putative iron-regulated membrane protein [Planomicrobium sp. HSC-17F08]|nr:putative iron-regulated membrane protein [Planomicrobium sp. HSC-17F08]
MDHKPKRRDPSLQRIIWRWHFYAGIIFAPILILLAVTGSIYLFKAEIEQVLYGDYYEVVPQETKQTAAEQLDKVTELYPNAVATKYRPGEDEQRSTEIKLSDGNESFTVFLDPYSGEVVGELADQDRIMDRIEELHGELMAGTIGDRIVELAACWALVLIVTGLYLWFPKNNKSLSGVVFPRFTKGTKILRRDLHAVPAFWITGGLVFLIMTGLPWSGFWGNGFQTLITNSGEGYPPSVWIGDAPKSSAATKEIAEVPWAAENLDVPLSNVEGLVPQPLDQIIETAEYEGIYPGYTVFLPQEKDGVYTLSIFSPKAQDEATMHIDQYTGAILADYRYGNYGVIGKIVAWGITLHKGTQFGLFNQLLSLAICIGLLLVVFSGLYLWWKRKPEKALGAPKAPSVIESKKFLLVIVAMGILFPLVGLSVLAVWLLDQAVIQRTKRVKKWLNA